LKKKTEIGKAVETGLAEARRTGSGSVCVGIKRSDGTFISSRELSRKGFKVKMRGYDNPVLRLKSDPLSGKITPGVLSQELTEHDDNWASVDDILESPWDFDQLCSLLLSNDTHDACIQTKAADIAYSGWELEEHPKLKDLGIKRSVIDQAKEEVMIALKTWSEGRPIEDLCRDVHLDFDSMGSAGFEVRRDAKGFIALTGLNHIPFNTMRILKRGGTHEPARYIQQRNQTKRFFVDFNHNVEFTDKDNKPFDPTFSPIEQFPAYKDRAKHIKIADNMLVDRDHPDEETRMLDQAASEFFFLARAPFNLSSIYGTPAGASAYSAVLGMLKLDAYNIQFFESKGVPQYAIVISGLTMPNQTADGDADEDNVDATAQLEQIIQEFFTEELTSSERGVLVFSAFGEATVTFQKLSAEEIDASFETYEKRCQKRIQIAHRLPDAALHKADVANLGSGRDTSQLQRYRDHIVTPGQRMLASIINSLIRSGLMIPYFNFVFKPINVEDEYAQKELLLTEFEKGAITLNQYARTTGRKTLPEGTGGDSYFIRGAQVTIVDNTGEVQTTLPGDIPNKNPTEGVDLNEDMEA
jgi:hypothetical protein